MINQLSNTDQFEELEDQIYMCPYKSPLASPKNKKHNPIAKPNQLLKLKFYSNPKKPQPNSLPAVPLSIKTENNQIIKIGNATFMCNFECGNMKTVEYINPTTYKITMNNQLNSDRRSIWFYFKCKGLKGEINFIIQGFTKKGSLYNEGMKLCYKDTAWKRGGFKISYSSATDIEQQNQQYSLKFTHFFHGSDNNAVEFAYSFPYSFSKLKKFIEDNAKLLKCETLAKSYQGRPIPLLTIGNTNSEQVIFVSARVHPGETVSSFIMQGFIKQLIGKTIYSELLRKNILFLILPMINIDGVYHGNYRFSASGCDLNRKWNSCTAEKHPEIYYWKEYILKVSKQKNILMYIDIHGHSRKKHVFFYGCSDDTSKQFPYLMSTIAQDIFRYDYCSFTMPKDKEGTARLTMSKQLKNHHIYTLESTFCGSNNSNYLQSDYYKIGKELCQGMCIYFSELLRNENNDEVTKLAEIKQNKLQQLYKSEGLKEVGVGDEQGSQSDPDTGENDGKYDQPPNYPKEEIINGGKKFLIKKIKQNYKHINILKKTIELNNVGDDNHQIARQSLPKPYTPGRIHYQSFTSHHNYPTIDLRQKMLFSLQGTKLASSNLIYQQNKLSTNHDINKKLLQEKRGVQYRRVRKLAEQLNQQYNPQKQLMTLNIISPMLPITPNGIIRPLINDHTDHQRKLKTISPQLGTSQGMRNYSIEAVHKKNERHFQSQPKKLYIKGQEIEIQCFGKKINIKN